MLATALTARPAPPAAPAAPLDLDERLALAALAVSDSGPLDLADVIRLPGALPGPEPAPCPYSTPVAACLHRAAARIASGWCTGRLVDEQGRRCLRGAIRAEAGGDWGTEVDACVLLLEVIRAEFGPDVETVPEANDHLLRGPQHAARILGAAATLADARHI
ncbi:hypothetical protein [Streptomyces sp. DH37]|uniref:DUF6197 family protein n=1 Tax=Streptomyces sp. DH37 TaxID=3040122 RepID=UPI002442210B|nr:hypothetical protein [Streptomyces sp. DH37]MDG9701680.1 hypothetical protein [Streptomyces sp. DH37]